MERQDFGAYVGSGPREKSNSSADPDLLNRNNFSYCALLKYTVIYKNTLPQSRKSLLLGNP
jgi:hypothetical protein